MGKTPLCMERNAYLSAIKSNGHALITACGRAPDADVAACPGWTNTELLGHVSTVWGFVATQVRAADPERPTRPTVDEDATPAGLLDDVLTALRTTDEAGPAWNWTPDLTVGFWVRRMAHETAVHGWDAEKAAGGDTPIAADLAADTIDEVIDLAFRYQRSGPVTDYPSGSLHLHRTDGEGEWLLVPGDDGLTVTREHARGDAALRGTASDLALYLWGRGREGLECFGDDSLIDAWASLAP